ncbi:MAG TPA: HPr family phosphocarrier protein [Hyphomicrobiaceae bacterium]|nr:HPr family phosphocarrier protein [Hyphomicrobiaceae bacterium]
MSSSGIQRADVTIRNKKGLHARASAKFVMCAEGFSARISVSRDGQSVGGTSIMGLLTLAASQGTTITITAEGADAREALIALVALVRDGFGEET